MVDDSIDIGTKGTLLAEVDLTRRDYIFCCGQVRLKEFRERPQQFSFVSDLRSYDDRKRQKGEKTGPSYGSDHLCMYIKI